MPSEQNGSALQPADASPSEAMNSSPQLGRLDSRELVAQPAEVPEGHHEKAPHLHARRLRPPRHRLRLRAEQPTTTLNVTIPGSAHDSSPSCGSRATRRSVDFDFARPPSDRTSRPSKPPAAARLAPTSRQPGRRRGLRHPRRTWRVTVSTSASLTNTGIGLDRDPRHSGCRRRPVHARHRREHRHRHRRGWAQPRHSATDFELFVDGTEIAGNDSDRRHLHRSPPLNARTTNTIGEPRPHPRSRASPSTTPPTNTRTPTAGRRRPMRHHPLTTHRLLIAARAPHAHTRSANPHPHHVTVTIPTYIGLRIVGTGTGPRSVTFDYATDPTTYLTTIDNGGGALPPTAVQPIRRRPGQRLGIGCWSPPRPSHPVRLHRPRPPGAGLTPHDLRVDRDSDSPKTPSPSSGSSAATPPPGTSPPRHQASHAASCGTNGWRSLGFNGLDYTLNVNGDEDAGTYTTTVTYYLTFP